MKMVLSVSLAVLLGQSLLCASEEQANADTIENMFALGKVSAKIETIYSAHDEEHGHSPYSTALGGQLKYELARYNGFTAGAEFTTSHDINIATGDDERHNSFISSTDGHYTQLSQAYVDYAQGDASLRIGRQLIDTPLADSDDYRIIDNTFEAAIARYGVSDFSLMAGYLARWQGTDAMLDPQNPWQDTGKDGTYLAGVSYEADSLSVSAWYYDISEASTDNTATGNVANRSFYLDGSVGLSITDSNALTLSAQYLQQDESDASGIESKIYGAMAELELVEDLSVSAAYNYARRCEGKQSFPGFGGGALFTNMDNMILDNITADRKATAIMAGLNYTYSDLTFFYAYADFSGDADSTGQKEHVVEQNIGIDYTLAEDFVLSALVTMDDDKEDTDSGAYPYYSDGDFVNYRLSLVYTF